MPLSVLRGARLPSDPWTARDRALAQAAEQLDRSKCPGCGTPLWLAYDPALERKWKAALPIRCHPCTAIAHKQRQYDESDAPEALRFPVELAN